MNVEQKIFLIWLVWTVAFVLVCEGILHLISKHKWKVRHKRTVELLRKRKQDQIRFDLIAKEIENID